LNQWFKINIFYIKLLFIFTLRSVDWRSMGYVCELYRMWDRQRIRCYALLGNARN